MQTPDSSTLMSPADALIVLVCKRLSHSRTDNRNIEILQLAADLHRKEIHELWNQYYDAFNTICDISRCISDYLVDKLSNALRLTQTDYGFIEFLAEKEPHGYEFLPDNIKLPYETEKSARQKKAEAKEKK